MGKLTTEINVGHEITGKLKHLTEERVWDFSGGYPKGPNWPAKNIHTNLEFARQCGLKTRAVSAAMFVGYLSELMMDLFGDNWLTSGKMDLKFIGMVGVDEKVISKAIITSKEPKGPEVKCSLDVWIEKENRDKVTVGTAAGFIK